MKKPSKNNSTSAFSTEFCKKSDKPADGAPKKEKCCPSKKDGGKKCCGPKKAA